MSELNSLMDEAKGWLLKYQSDPEKAIPAEIFQDAEGIFFYQVVGGSFIIGAQSGEGFAMVRDGSGWSPPAFYSVTSGSFGAQIGGGETTVLMFLMNKEGLKVLARDDAEWSGTASATGGPSSASASDNWSSDDTAEQNETDPGKADIFFYTTSSGLEASAAIKGTESSYDKKANDTYYQKTDLSRQSIYGGSVPMPEKGAAFANLLNNMAESE
ncbi:MAG: lipid-binding SYLF domain-containing protein [Verrucomicrobiota bacterium]